MALVDVGIEWALPIPRDEQRKADLAQVDPLLLRVPALREGRALVATRQISQKVCSVVAERIELERKVVNHLAGQGGRDRVSGQP